MGAPFAGASTSPSADPAQICVCAHPASIHADPAIGDTRCLAVEDRNDLLHHFDDGRETQHGCCACLHYEPTSTPAADPPIEGEELSGRWSEFASSLRAAARALSDGRGVPGLEDFR